MALLAAKESELPVEERLARLESHVEHMQSDITEIKVDLRRLDGKVDGVKDSLNASINGLKDLLNHSVNELKASTAAFALQTERSFSRLIRWGLLLYAALAGSLLGIMAHGLKWI